MEIEYHVGYAVFTLIAISPLVLAYAYAFDIDLLTLRYYYLARVIPAVIFQSIFPIHLLVSLLFIAFRALVKVVSRQNPRILIYVHHYTFFWMALVSDWLATNGEIIERTVERWWEEKVWPPVCRIADPVWPLVLRGRKTRREAFYARQLEVRDLIENPPPWATWFPYPYAFHLELCLSNFTLKVDELHVKMEEYWDEFFDAHPPTAGPSANDVERWLAS